MRNPDERNEPEAPPAGQVLIYTDGAARLQVRLDGATVWLPQRLIAELYQVTVLTVIEHLRHIDGEGELEPGATTGKFLVVQTELHWAIHGHTAAEIIKDGADASTPRMGLTTWKNAPAGPVRKADHSITSHIER
jgi:hypothetical protein